MWSFVEVTSKRSIGAAFCSRAKKKKKVQRKRTGEEGEEKGIIVRCKGKKGIDALLCRVGLNPFRKSLTKKALQLCSRAWREGGRERYLGAEEVLLRENGCYAGGSDR